MKILAINVICLFVIISNSSCREYSPISEVLITSSEKLGYEIFMDGEYIGTEGTGGDMADGDFALSIVGDYQHSVIADDGIFTYGLLDFFFVSGMQYTIPIDDQDMNLGPSGLYSSSGVELDDCIKPNAETSMASQNQPPSITILLPNKSSPQATGSTVVWTAKAGDPDGDTVVYRFWLKGPSTGNAWDIVQDWCASNTWTWITDLEESGEYEVAVSVRDERHESTASYDDCVAESYQLNSVQPNVSDNGIKINGAASSLPTTSNIPPMMVNLEPDVSSPQYVGSKIKWTTTATDDDNDLIYYQFWLSGPKTDSVWQVVQDWSLSNMWYWVSSDDDVGYSNVRVCIRDGHHANASDMDDFEEYYDYQIKPIELENLDVEITNSVYSEDDRNVYYCQEGQYFYVLNRVYLTGPDLDKVENVRYVLHPSFPNPVQVSEDATNEFEIWIWTWGRFPVQAIITTNSGQTFEKSSQFTFKSKVEEAQRIGIPMIRKCE